MSASLSRVATLLFRAYRATLSYAFGPCCRFHPSCSAYAEEALRVHGFGRGTLLAAWRLLRCHPLCAGGLDPVPSRRPGRQAGVGRAIAAAGTPSGD